MISSRRQHEIAAGRQGGGCRARRYIATDMFWRPPCNLALTLLERGKIEGWPAPHLPSLIKLIDIRAKLPLEQAVKEAIEAGRKYIAPAARTWPRTDGRTVRQGLHSQQTGLHARASAKIDGSLRALPSEIYVIKDGIAVKRPLHHGTDDVGRLHGRGSGIRPRAPIRKTR